MRTPWRWIFSALLAALPVAAHAATPEGQQELVDRATLAAQEIMSGPQGTDPRALLPRARAGLVWPRVFRAGGKAGGR